MKIVFLSITLIAIAASCTSEMVEGIGTPAPDIMATYDNGGLTKTTLTTDEEGVGTIWWKPADQINIFYGTTSTKYTSTNTEDATTVVFSTTDVIGSTESASTNRWGLYPYDKSAKCDGSSVTTTIPASQKAVAGTFDDDLFTSLAHSTSTTMTFYNVLGGIKFSLSRDDIQSITFKGNNSENIAGKVKLTMDSDGKPKATMVISEKTIKLTPKTGTTFAKNTNYYIVILPGVLSKGFTMTFETTTEIGYFNYSANSIEIKRSVFGNKANIDSYASFISKTSVDLGLSVKWASCNLGASRPEEYGEYYAWGETEPKSKYDWTTYKLCKGTATTLTKYCFNQDYWGGSGTCDKKYTLVSSDDAAHVNLGGNWRMPTYSEWTELCNSNNCTWEWIKLNGSNGYKVTSKKVGYTDKWIFLSANGYYNGTSSSNVGAWGRYWSSSLSTSETRSARFIDMGMSSGVTTSGYTGRIYGLAVRPVSE